MKLNFIEDDAKSLIVEFEGADRSIAEMIKSKLMDSKDVDFVGVLKEHPDIAKPRLIVKPVKNARSLVSKAIEELQDDVKGLSSNLPKK